MSVVGRDAAIRSARYHLERATTPGLVEYWTRVLNGLGEQA